MPFGLAQRRKFLKFSLVHYAANDMVMNYFESEFFLYWVNEEYPGKRGGSWGWVNLSCVWRVFKIEFDSNEVAKTWKYDQMPLFHGMIGVFLINWKLNTELSSVPLENSRPEIYFLDSARWSYSTLSTATWWNHLYCNSREQTILCRLNQMVQILLSSSLSKEHSGSSTPRKEYLYDNQVLQK